MEDSEQRNETASLAAKKSVVNNHNNNNNNSMKRGEKKKSKVRRMISGKISATKTILLTKLLQRHRRLDCDSSSESESESVLRNENNYHRNGHSAIEKINQQMVNNQSPSGKLSPIMSSPSSPPRIESSMAPKLMTNDNGTPSYLPINNNNNNKVKDQHLPRATSPVNYYFPSSATNDHFVSPLRDLLTPSIYGGLAPDAESVDSSRGINQPYYSGHSFGDVVNDTQSSLGSFDDNEIFPIATSPETPQTQTSLSNMDLVKRIDESPNKDDPGILIPILDIDDHPHISPRHRLSIKSEYKNTPLRDSLTSKLKMSKRDKQTTKAKLNYNQQRYILILPITITIAVTISAISTIVSMITFQTGDNGILFPKVILHINSPPTFITFIASLLALFFGFYIPIQTRKLYLARQGTLVFISMDVRMSFIIARVYA